MKKLMCLCLAAAVLAGFAAGCSVNVKDIGPTTAITPSTIDDEELNQAVTNLGAENLDELDADALKALEDKLLSQGVLPEGVTLPAETSPTPTMPPTMPAGNKIKGTEVEALIKNVYTILNSGNYLLKAKGSTPVGETTNSLSNMAMTFAVSKGGKSMVEFDVDWTAMMRAMADAEGTNKNQAAIQGATAQTLFGKKIRMVTTKTDTYMVFVEKKTYFAMSSVSEEGSGGLGVNTEDFNEMFIPKENLNADVDSSKVTLSGKEYLCATIKSEGTTIRYYFLGKDLKRIEMEAAGQTSILEIDTLTGTVDDALFSVSGYKEMPLSQLTSMSNSLGALFGAGISS